MDPKPPNVTQILLRLKDDGVDQRAAADQLFAVVHDELRQMAGKIMSAERAGHTLQATALVHEAYLKLIDQSHVNYDNRGHFFGIASRAMRQILVDYARSRGAAKRGGGWDRVTLDECLGLRSEIDMAEIVDLDQALTKLADKDERMARVVELRVFAGFSTDEVAQALGVSRRTVQNDWQVARMWLAKEMLGGQGGTAGSTKDGDS